MSPEQARETAGDPHTDIWSLGIVLYECLCGRRPFEAESSFSTFVLVAGTEPPPPMDPRVPRGLQAVVLRCLEKDPAARFPSVAALAAALAPFAHDQRADATILERAYLAQQYANGDSEHVASLAREPVVVATTVDSNTLATPLGLVIFAALLLATWLAFEPRDREAAVIATWRPRSPPSHHGPPAASRLASPRSSSCSAVEHRRVNSTAVGPDPLVKHRTYGFSTRTKYAANVWCPLETHRLRRPNSGAAIAVT
jgi:serine/threonine protein kinase